ncbi:MAG: hypothetical protein ACFHX7_02885 [Pseudomonadota bacterium]
MFESARLLAVLLLLPLAANADVLFESDAPIAFRLEGPVTTWTAERDKEKAYPGRISWEGESFPVEVTLRGNHRLKKSSCRYPPLRLEFDKEVRSDTIFDKQKDIKLVVQCKPGGRFLDYLRVEYLTYQALALLTPLSYQARWVELTYVDTDGEQEPRVEPAFFVERKARLAKRVGLETTDVERISVDALDADQAALIALFQFVIANADYSMVAPPPGDVCCHNAKLLIDADNRYIPVIYDFDSAGLVDASYALPAGMLGQTDVRQRFYRGYCAHNDAVTRARDQLLALQTRLTALFDSDPLLSNRQKKKAVKFLDAGFDILKTPRRFDREIIGECRG